MTLLYAELKVYEKHLYSNIIKEIYKKIVLSYNSKRMSFYYINYTPCETEYKFTKAWNNESLLSYFTSYYYIVLSELEHLKHKHRVFIKKYESFENKDKQKNEILHFSKQLGSSAKELKKDRKAFDRFFEVSAIIERFYLIILKLEKILKYTINRVAFFLNHQHKITKNAEAMMPAIADTFLNREARNDILLEVLVSLKRECLFINSLGITATISTNTHHLVLSLAKKYKYNIWVICEAIEILSIIDFPSYESVCHQWFDELKMKDDNFIRHKIILSIACHLDKQTTLDQVVKHALLDSSPYVRQAICKILHFMTTEKQLYFLK